MSNLRLRRHWRRHAVVRAESPATWELPTPAACAGIFLATRTATTSVTRTFHDGDRLWEALARGEIAVDQTVRCETRVTTVGRHLVLASLPPTVAALEADTVWSARRIAHVLEGIARTFHVEFAARTSAALERLGLFVVE